MQENMSSPTLASDVPLVAPRPRGLKRRAALIAALVAALLPPVLEFAGVSPALVELLRQIARSV